MKTLLLWAVVTGYACAQVINNPTPSYVGNDVRSYGAALNGTGVSGAGTDDSTALKNCLGGSTAFNPCIIPNTVIGGTTHLRIATPIDIPGTANGPYRLTCAGSNTDGFSGSGQVVIDVDLNNGIAGPAIFFGDANDAPFQGVVIDRGCMFRDITTLASGHHTSPGAIGMLNWSNDYMDFNAAGFNLPALGASAVTIPVASATSPASCSNTGGSIASGGSLFAVYQPLGPGWGPAPKSAEVTNTLTALGCTSGSACSCTPVAPTGVANGVTAVAVFWSTTTGTELQVGMPYVCNGAGSCPMTQNFNYTLAPTSATAVTCMPGTANAPCTVANTNSPDAFDHSGAYGLYGQGAKGWQCGSHGDACTTNQFINQLHLTGNDFDNMWIALDFDNAVAAAMINGCHVNLNTKGQMAIQTESGILVQGCHFEGGGGTAGPQAHITGNTSSQFINDFFESGSAITGISGVGMVKSQFVVTCGNTLTTCFTDDAASSNNNGIFNNFVGALSYQQTDDIISTARMGARSRITTGTKSLSSVTPSAFTNFSWGIEASQNYSLDCYGTYQAASTGGLQLTVTGPASPTNVTYSYNQGTTISAGAVTYNWLTATGASYPTSVGVAVTTTATDMPFDFHMKINNGSTAGNIVLKMNSAAAVSTTVERINCRMDND